MANWLTPLGQSSPFIGEFAALTAAFLWAAATLMFGKLGRQLSPVALNLIKGLLATVFIALTLVVQSAIAPRASHHSLSGTATLWLLLSGGIGIGLGDTAYFAAINALGPRRALLLETLAPPMAAVLAWIFLAEQLPWAAAAGIIITLAGVAWVISERVPGTTTSARQAGGAGVRVALLAAFCQAAGAVLSRAALAETAVEPLWSTLLRLLAGIAFMSCLAVARPEYLKTQPQTDEQGKQRTGDRANTTGPALGRWQTALLAFDPAALAKPRLLLEIAIASFFATYLGIWLQQLALKHAATGVAQALLATSPLFVLPMAALLGERISWRAAGGVLVALGGVWLLLYS